MIEIEKVIYDVIDRQQFELAMKKIAELEADNTALKARIKAMEEQEPVACVDGGVLNFIADRQIQNGDLFAAPTTAMLDNARDEEREECAKACEDRGCSRIETVSTKCAAAIRARGMK